MNDGTPWKERFAGTSRAAAAGDLAVTRKGRRVFIGLRGGGFVKLTLEDARSFGESVFKLATGEAIEN